MEQDSLEKAHLSARSLAEILAGDESSNKHVKGTTLELVALYLARLIGLDFQAWLLKDSSSRSHEAELAANHLRMPFGHWVIQCRDAQWTDEGPIATALGRSIAFKPSVLLSATTGYFTDQARYYANKTMEMTNLQILLMDAHDIIALSGDEKTIATFLAREAEHARAIKQSQLTLLQVLDAGMRL